MRFFLTFCRNFPYGSPKIPLLKKRHIYKISYQLQNVPVGRHILKLRIKDEAFKKYLVSEFHDHTTIIDIVNYAPVLSYSSPTKSFEYDSGSLMQWDLSDSSINNSHYEILTSALYIDDENLDYFSGFEIKNYDNEKYYVLFSGDLTQI